MLGLGSFSHWLALFQLDDVIILEEYLISYPVTVPESPSSPGALQVNCIELDDKAVALRSVTAFGSLLSVEIRVVPFAILDNGE